MALELVVATYLAWSLVASWMYAGMHSAITDVLDQDSQQIIERSNSELA